MPTYLFTCDNGHTIEKIRPTPFKRGRRYRCEECGLWCVRDYVKEHNSGKRVKALNMNPDKDPISHISKKRSFRGIWIENLTPKPVFVRTHEQYKKLLKDTHSREKIA